MKKPILFMLFLSLMIVACKNTVPEEAETPTLETITLTTSETYNYLCFKSIRGAELWLLETEGIKYEAKYEVVNNQLDENVKKFMSQNGYNVTVTYISGSYVINIKRGNTYYINMYS